METYALSDIPVYAGVVPPDQGDCGPPVGWDALAAPLGSPAPSGLSETHRAEAKHVIAVYARELLSQPDRVHYTQGAARWSGIAHHKDQADLLPFSGDCSSTATFMLWRALIHVHPGIRDLVNGEHWAAGFTGTIARHGKTVVHDSSLEIGDLLLYGPAPDFEHVTVYMGGGICFSHGGEAGPFPLHIDYRNDRHLAKRFI